MVLVVVLAVIMMMTILVIGMLGRNVSRAMVTEKQIRRIQAEALAEGAFWRAYQDDGDAPNSFFVDGYRVTYTQSDGTGPFSVNMLNE